MCTNVPPLDDEVSRIHTIFHEAPQHLSVLDEEIGRTSSENDLAQLLHKRLDLASFLTDKPRILSHILSPTRRVPAELISEFALYALHRYTACPIPVSLGTQTSAIVGGTAWILAQVCRSWRSNLISLSQLWSHVEVSLPTPNSASIIHELLRRSGSSMLYLTINIKAEESIDVSETVDLCFRHTHRWKDLRIVDYSRSHWTLTKLNSMRDAFPQLESLCLTIYRCNYDAGRLTILNAFEFAPRLKAVSIQLGVDAPAAPRVLLPWKQLEYYSNMEYIAHSWRNPLSSFSQLHECCLHGFIQSFQIPPSHVRFPFLRSLEVKHLDVLSHLIVPKLERLRIWSRPIDWTPVAELIDRSACDLQSLMILQNRTASSLTRLLRVVPSLVSFEVKFNDMPSFHQLVSSLVIEHDTQRREVLLPKLQHLTIVWPLHYCQSHDLELDKVSDSLVRVVESRSHIPRSGDDFAVPCLSQIRFELVRVSQWRIVTSPHHFNLSGIHVRDLEEQLEDVQRKFDDLEDRFNGLKMTLVISLGRG